VSELTTCNYCNLKDMKSRYKKMNKEITVAPSKEMSGWLAAIVDGKETAWFMEVGDRCSC